MSSENLQISTPEGIRFSLPIAGPVSRLLALIVDGACVAGAGGMISTLLMPFGWISADFVVAFNVLAFFVISTGYGMAAEWFWRGQTIGKRVMHLRVVDSSGLNLQPSQVVIRNLLRSVDAFPAMYLLGGLVVLFTSKGQRLGDLAAGTVVVHARRETLPDLEQLLVVRFNSLREHPHLAARLAQRLSAAEAALGLRSLQRRDLLDSEARVKLFRELADHYRRRVDFPDATVEHLADERYVRNVVDVVFRPK
jgi:uncharacterized RDD family membrane protein YckC